MGPVAVNRALLYSLGLCVLSVGLESLFAGAGIKQRLAELRVPRFAPPLWGWIVIGICYYVICFTVLYRLFSISPTGGLRLEAFVVLGGIMSINAFWNYFFFRTRNLFHAYLIGLPYAVLAVALFGILLRIDRVAAWSFFPYVVYLVYASRLGYLTWKLNEPTTT
jgi:tryptophan-rich sensory protein